MARIASSTGRYKGRSATERQSERRDRFREAGLDAFGAGPGYREARLVDICKAAGLSTRQFYQEYDTAEDLLAELHLLVNDTAERHVLDELARAATLPPVERAVAMFRAYIAGITADPRHLRLAFVEIAGVSARMDQQRLQRRARWLALLTDLFESAAQRGEIAPRDFRITAAAFVASINGLLHDWALGWVDATLDQVVDELLRILLGSVGLELDPAPVEARPTPAPAPRDRRALILHTAAETFARRGYHRASMAELAAAAGTTAPTLYRHFGTKQGLLAACLFDGLDRTLSRLAESGDDASLDALVRVALDTRGLSRLWQHETRTLTPARRFGVLTRVVRLVHRIGDEVDARHHALDRADREVLSWFVLSVVTSPAAHRIELPVGRFTEVLDGVVRAVADTEIRTLAAAATTGPDDDIDREPRPDRLLVAAARLFHRRGYAAVSMEEIGAAVGVSGPALYHHFASKADLLDEIIDRTDQGIRRHTERALVEGADSRDALRLILRSYVRFAVRQPDLVGTMLTEIDHLPADAAARYRRAHRRGITRWSQLLQALRPELSAPVARILVHAAVTVINDAARNPRVVGRDDIVDLLCLVGERIADADVWPGP